ncbi:MAG TPA: threonine synthase [Propionibacteriaceae bacterium]|nr:threonine synthase [Propionibacteriaceae bacterium]
MRYVSTRGGGDPRQFCDILLEGLAPDGGLYLPATYPRLDAATLAEWRQVLADDGYAALAHRVLLLFVDDIGSDDLLAICQRAYTAEKFGTDEIVPVTPLGDNGMWLAHLSEGPTAAFKDLAMQLLGELFEYELTRRGRTLTILGATSGDTGSAAEHAMLGKESVRVFMLSPRGRMTPFQQAQMYGIDNPAIVNITVAGPFDDCQDLVKGVFADLQFRADHSLGAVNSINWGRLVAQVVYYVASWLRVTEADDEQVSFCVPSGNFGNICAGHVAREMGIPIRRLILATNENNVLDEFLRTGVYRVRPSSETYETSSPSMDISKASNFERFIFDLLGRDAERVRELFAGELVRTGQFDLSDTSEFAALASTYGFVSGTSTHADRVETIRTVHARTGVTIDPHTADGVKVAEGFVGNEPVIVCETALPVKFSATIVEALGHEPERPERFVGLESLPQHVVDLHGGVDALKSLIVERV